MSLDADCDVLIIGGGIYGAWIAYDAALRGLRTIIVERDDWASGTSSASSKLIHGGLRYLEYGDVGLVAKALRERARLRRLAPHAVRELRFLLPHTRDFRVNRAALFAGLWAYDHLAGSHPGIAPHHALSRSELLRHAPYLRRDDLVAGWEYGDGAEDDARFVLELIDGAAAAGATVQAHCPAIRLLRSQGRVQGALVRDTIANSDHEIHARVVIDAAGAWAGTLLPAGQFPARHTKGVHLTLPPLPHDQALLLQTPDKRVYFCLPYYGATLVGTTDTDYRGNPDQVNVDDQDVDYVLAAINARCPGLNWTRGDVRAGFAGLRTLRGLPGAPSSVTREWELYEPEAGLLIPLGGKYTSARVEAARTVRRALAVMGRSDGPEPTAARLCPWAPSGAFEPWYAAEQAAYQHIGCDAETATWLPRRHGRRGLELRRLLAEQTDLTKRCHPLAPFCRGELVWAARRERVHTLLDVLRRRVPLMILVPPDQSVIAEATRLVGNELGWNAARREREIHQVTISWWTASPAVH
jgi:glycerol-3-phosphate dehydrogenase